jgi:hypothetical protein
MLTLISGFCRDVDEICGLLGYLTASCGNYLPTFRDNVSVPSSRVKIQSRKALLLGILTREDGTDTFSRYVVNNYHTTPCNNPEDHRLHEENHLIKFSYESLAELLLPNNIIHSLHFPLYIYSPTNVQFDHY